MADDILVGSRIINLSTWLIAYYHGGSQWSRHDITCINLWSYWVPTTCDAVGGHHRIQCPLTYNGAIEQLHVVDVALYNCQSTIARVILQLCSYIWICTVMQQYSAGGGGRSTLYKFMVSPGYWNGAVALHNYQIPGGILQFNVVLFEYVQSCIKTMQGVGETPCKRIWFHQATEMVYQASVRA